MILLDLKLDIKNGNVKTINMSAYDVIEILEKEVQLGDFVKLSRVRELLEELSLHSISWSVGDFEGAARSEEQTKYEEDDNEIPFDDLEEVPEKYRLYDRAEFENALQ